LAEALFDSLEKDVCSPTPGWLRRGVWLTAIILGSSQVYSSRFLISSDGNNYLDVASAYLQHDWPHAINGWWSPMLSWILAGIMYQFHLSPYWDSTMIHLVNLGGFLISLISFEFLLSSLLKARSRSSQTIDELTWWLLGYALFLSASLSVLTLSLTTPDLWVNAIVYLVAGIVVRMRDRNVSVASFMALGGLLGVGYLFKSFLLPWGFVVLLTVYLVTRHLLRTIVAAATCAALAAPFILVLSHEKNRFTFGDTGRLAYFMFIERPNQPAFWHGENHTGIPKHPTREILTAPRLYEFGAPVGGSYPPYYDMSYWLDGAVSHFHFSAQLAIFRQSVGTYYLIWVKQMAFTVGIMILLFELGSPRDYLKTVTAMWHLALPCLLACLAYGCVLVEERYVVPFLSILWLVAFAALLSGTTITRRLSRAVALTILLVTFIQIAKTAVSDFAAARSSAVNINWQVAEGLYSLGIRSGDRVAGIAIMGKAHWARLAGVKIVSEIPLGDESQFWNADPHLHQTVIEAFAGTGAKAIVVESPPSCAVSSGWTPLAGTDYYAYLLGPNRTP
jgi:hypothetical protein